MLYWFLFPHWSNIAFDLEIFCWYVTSLVTRQNKLTTQIWENFWSSKINKKTGPGVPLWTPKNLTLESGCYFCTNLENIEYKIFVVRLRKNWTLLGLLECHKLPSKNSVTCLEFTFLEENWLFPFTFDAWNPPKQKLLHSARFEPRPLCINVWQQNCPERTQTDGKRQLLCLPNIFTDKTVEIFQRLRNFISSTLLSRIMCKSVHNHLSPSFTVGIVPFIIELHKFIQYLNRLKNRVVVWKN